ncbi:acyl-CoA dehydrogenase family protein [Micromonospora sp. NPDC049102]|uniref:acyl-CoA dehydrogenase family protein n=1 Tax=Micromonospora sp. NPDC049102 TaxID=3364265 RepID=UPI00371A541C
MTVSVDNVQSSTDVLATLDTVIDDVVRPQAETIDREGAFPRAGVDALATAGLLGLASSPEVGGGGQGMRRQRRLVRLGFRPDEAVALSALHTRNFM